MNKRTLIILCLALSLTACQKLEVKREYYPDGKLMVEKFIRGRKAVNKVYHTNGKLIGVYEYKDGSLNGVSTIYNNDGELFKKIKYVNGKQVDVKFFGPRGEVLFDL